MGWAVLYIAFGAVAIWLLAEVLLQYKARLRWRLLAFAGFATVVLGVVALSSVIVITLGAMAFAVGQTFVTLSYRRGFSTGWALGGMPGSSRRRRDGRDADALPGEDADPALEVSGVEEEHPGGGHGEAEYVQDPYDTSAYDPPAYHPQPMPDETGGYGVYDRDDDPSVFAPAAHADPSGGGYGGLGGDEAYGYGRDDQHQYAAYSDPYIGYDSGQTAGTGYDGHAAAGYGAQQDYGTQDYAAEGYGRQEYGGQEYGGQPGYGDGGYDADSYGGAWVPQQRESDQQPVPEQSYPYQDPYGAGGYGGGYGDDGLGTGYGYGYSYPETGYPAEDGYGDGRNAGQGYDTASGYQYDEQRGY